MDTGNNIDLIVIICRTVNLVAHQASFYSCFVGNFSCLVGNFLHAWWATSSCLVGNFLCIKNTEKIEKKTYIIKQNVSKQSQWTVTSC